jgi:hypothetical protein
VSATKTAATGGGQPAARRVAAPLRLIPSTLRDAAGFAADHHRHLGPPRGHRFSIAAAAGEDLVGVVIVGRPVARMFDDGLTAEVTRL